MFNFKDYIETDIEEKKEIIQKWNENEARYQERLRRKYNLDNVFKKENTKENNNTSMIEYKKNIFQRIFEKIKEIIKLK